MSSRRILSLILCGLSLQYTDAFLDPLIVGSRTPRLSTAAKFSPRRTSFGHQNERPYREHKALSVPFSGPRADYKSQQWEDLGLHGNSESKQAALGDKVIVSATLAAAIVAFYTLMTATAAGSWRFFAAGGICAATSHAIPTPIDVVKTRKQVDPSLANKSFADAARDIVKKEGFSALWAGLGPTAWGYLLEGAMKFGVYEVLKPFVKNSLSKLASYLSIGFLNSSILAFILCGMASGVAASLMLCPMEAIRIRMVAEPEFAPQGWLEAGCKMFQQEGASGLFKGIAPMISKQVPYTVTKNVSFDLVTKSFYAFLKAQGMALTATTMFAVPLFSAAIASVLSTITSQPGDLVLSLVNAHKGGRSANDIFRNIMRSERGVRGFFVGFNARLLHVGVTVTVQLLVYDYVKRLCGIAATGSC